jgi:hypothetical protein
MLRRSILGVLAAVAVGLLSATALGQDIKRTLAAFNPTGTLLSGGDRVKVGGHLTCTAGDHIFVRVTVTQNETAALAEKDWGNHVCTGANQSFGVTATWQGTERFAPGAATACALARTSNGSRHTGAIQWCSNITLHS